LWAKWIIVNRSNNISAYNLEKNVLRQEIAVVTYRLAWLEKKSYCENKFKDITATSPNNWVCGVVEALLEAGLVSPNENFNPERYISKSEALAMMVRALYKHEYRYNPDLTTSWQEQVVGFASKNNIVENFIDYDNNWKRW